MREIPLTRGYVAMVDDADFPWLSQWKWWIRNGRKTVYAVRGEGIRMHREIMCNPEGLEIDHIDHNGLNNQRNNLRIVTRSENGANMNRRPPASGFRGVYWDKVNKKWQAHLMRKRKTIHFSRFDSLEEAVKAIRESGLIL